MLVHNHTGEFMPLTDVPQRTEYDVYLKETDPSLVAMQLDIGWATIAGQDVPAMFRANPGRYELWHIKDMFGIRSLNAKRPPIERVDAVTFDKPPLFERSRNREHSLVRGVRASRRSDRR